MDTAILQQKLAAQGHLLPSQHELLNRLLFQLAFNDFQNIGLVGAEGSGKSTLALALAELFSEQANVALLSGPLNESEIEAQLLQQWFGQRQADPALSELIAESIAGALPLLLIVDNFSLLSASAQQKLLQLDCLGLFMLVQASTEMALNLSINVPTLQDAGQILKDKGLDPLAIAERFAASAGNMHLLHSAVCKAEEQKSHRSVFWLLPAAIILLLFAVGISWLVPTASDVPSGANTIGTDTPVIATLDNSLEPKRSFELSNTAGSASITDLPDGLEHDVSSEPIIIVDVNGVSDPAADPEQLAAYELQQTAVLLAEVESQDAAEFDTLAEIAAASQHTTEHTPQTVESEPAAGSVSRDIAPVLSSADNALYQEQALLALPADYRVLQLAVLSSEAALARFRQTYPDTAVLVYQRSWQGQLQWVILAESHFLELSTARQGRAALAESLRAAGAFIKPVAQVQQEIKALARLRAEPLLQE